MPLAFSINIFFSVGGGPKWLFVYFTTLNLKPAIYKILICILQILIGQCFMTACLHNTDAIQRIIWSLGSYLGIIIFFIIQLSWWLVLFLKLFEMCLNKRKIICHWIARHFSSKSAFNSWQSESFYNVESPFYASYVHNSLCWSWSVVMCCVIW